MKKNMGLADRIIRFSLAVIIAVLYFTGQISGTAAIILGIFAVLFIVTSFLAFCPAYLPIKFSTVKKSEKS
jgi:Na+(H+)/acetate symporter ActP